MRKIIQITTCGVENNAGTQCSVIMTALCDDGTAWISYGHHPWQPVEPIPQDRQKEAP